MPARSLPVPTLTAARATLSTRFARRKALQDALHPLGLGTARAANAMCLTIDLLLDPSLDAALGWLGAGVTVTLTCPSGNNASFAEKHDVVFHPDGRIEPLGHGDNFCLATELMLGALAGATCPCVVFANTFPPSGSVASATSVNSEASFGGNRLQEAQARTMWALVQWAAVPSPPDWSLIAPLLKSGFTPNACARWRSDGWTMKQMAPFVKAGCTPEQALPWLLARKTGASQAPLAAAGQTPNDEALWVAAGFTASGSVAWRRLTTLTPEQALRWKGVGVTPSTFLRIERALSLLSVSDGLTLDEVLRWAAAGIPALQVSYWWEIPGRSLPDALALFNAGVRWSAMWKMEDALFRPIPVAAAGPVLVSMRRVLPRVAGVATSFVVPVLAWIAAGADPKRDAEVLFALRSGLTPAQFVAFDGRGSQCADRWVSRVEACVEQAQRSV